MRSVPYKSTLQNTQIFWIFIKFVQHKLYFAWWNRTSQMESLRVSFIIVILVGTFVKIWFSQEIVLGFKDGLFDSIIFGSSVITSFIRQQYTSSSHSASTSGGGGGESSRRMKEIQHKNTQSANVLKRIRQCIYLSGFLMVSSCCYLMDVVVC